MKEIWKDIENYDGCYQISNLGRVKSLARIVDSRQGVKQQLKERILKRTLSGGGYPKYHLTRNNVGQHLLQHRLVAKAFIPNPDNLPCVNHIDGNKQNGVATNLEWCTYSRNSQHAYENNLFPDNINLGEKNGRSVLSAPVVLTIRESFKHFWGIKEYFCHDMAELFSVSRTTVFRIINQSHWNIEKGAL